MSSLSPTDERQLALQALAGWAAFAVVGPAAIATMRVARANRIEGVAEARRVYRRALASGRPTLICANHLTMVDSAFLLHALASVRDYLRDFRRFAWNVPAVEHFTTNAFLRALVYLGKCIAIDREGTPEHRRGVLARIKHLTAHGNVVMLFPEGGRSRTGRVDVDNVMYGVGEVLRDLDKPQVLCAYLRGERQTTYGNLPAFGDTLHLDVELLQPTTAATGLRASRELSRQVIEKLREMEGAHFTARSHEWSPLMAQP